MHKYTSTKTALITIILILTTAAAACASAGNGRVTVGFLPFESQTRDTSALTHTIPYLINWSLWYVPKIDRVGSSSDVGCMQINKLHRPSDPNDLRGWSRLAQALGVDYLVSGTAESSTNDRTHFSVYVYSSKDQGFIYTIDCDCKTSDLANGAAGVAIKIAEKMGVPAAESVPLKQHASDLPMLCRIEEGMQNIVSLESDSLYSSTGEDQLANTASESEPAYIQALGIYHSSWTITSGPPSKFERWADKEPRNIWLKLALLGQCAYSGANGKLSRYAEELVKIDPTSPITRAFADSARVRLGRQPAASGVVCAPDIDWPTALELAAASDVLDDYSDADRLLDSLRKREANNAYVRYRIGQIYDRSTLGRRAKAISDYEAALKINPDSYRILYCLGSCYAKLDRLNDAAAVRDKLLKKWPDRTDGHLLAARIYYKQNQREKMLDELEHIRNLDPDGKVIGKDYLSRQYYHSGRYMESLREMMGADSHLRSIFGIVMFVLMLIFLLGVLVLSLIVRAIINSERRKKGIK